ncbi:MAG: desulfoferrodoxin [Clostridiales bacterium]|nr:desulfoferrodoxin [Clostridia bacterium]MCR4563587.1 desulfoferrodoxin [Clostridiales bacterium]
MRFFKCSHCGNIIAFVENKGVPVKCCGEKMEEIVANTVDAAKEKHVPVIKVDGNLVTVTVGDVAHPMLAEHSILWVALETKQGAQRKELAVGGEPSVQFALVDGDEVKAAYAYCNLHGLWKAEA